MQYKEVSGVCLCIRVQYIIITEVVSINRFQVVLNKRYNNFNGSVAKSIPVWGTQACPFKNAMS